MSVKICCKNREINWGAEFLILFNYWIKAAFFFISEKFDSMVKNNTISPEKVIDLYYYKS
ncbi:hypothetical protein CQ046_04655 [Chryseobacterium sp. MYb7]|nr:hypothetical protein CQ046_04655 [Chryseobacterium sp. MYb7]